MRPIHKEAIEDIEIELKPASRALGFGLASLKTEGSSVAFGDGVPLTSMTHPTRVRRVAVWRTWVAERLVGLAEAIGDQIFYGRDK